MLILLLAAGATGGSASAARAGKSNPFVLSTTSPVAATTISGNVVWQVGYTGTTPDKVNFYVDGKLKWTDFVVPFRFNGDSGTLDASTLSVGRHNLKAVGYRSSFSSSTSVSVNVSSTAPSPGLAPSNTSVPAISGDAVSGNTLKASTGTWSGSPTSYAYQWQRCDAGGTNCQSIGGATGQAYLLGGADVGQTLGVAVTANNNFGVSLPAASAATGIVRADLALGRPAFASSSQNTSYLPGMANDSSSTTRWSSAPTDNQWWQVDLGAVDQVSAVSLNWETAYPSTYKVQVSTAGVTFTDAATVSSSSSGWQTTTFGPVSARYVRVLGVTRATVWGISLWNAQVLGWGGTGAVDSVSSPPPSSSGGGTGLFDPRTAWLKAPWNADATTASIDPSSEPLIATWVARGNIKSPNVCTNRWSAAWNTGKATDPKYDVAQTKYPGPLDPQIPIPRGTLASPDSDAHLVVFDLTRNRVDEFWQASYDSTNDSWSAGSGVSFDIGGTPSGGGSNAAGFPQLALAIWPEEIQAGVINHALAFSAPKAAPGFRYPARHSDGQGDLSDLPEGAWLALPASLTPNSAWPAWVKVVFTALQQHGMFLMDQGGTLGIAGVNPINGGVSWSQVGMGTGGSAGFPSDFPWSSMRVLKPPAA